VSAATFRARHRWRFHPAFLLAFAILAAPVHAQECVYTLDPAQTKIEFSLDATLHTVHGTFRLKSGTVRFDPATGKASGAIVVDATSGNSENASRDKKMHADVLESAKFSEIVFAPATVQGAVAAQGTSQVSVAGKLRLRGQDHDVTLVFSVQHGAGNQLQAETHFDVPFIAWGLKDPSNFFLHVGKRVSLHIVAQGQFAPGSGIP
jgi:polyisoprenoid-binding protein YceI